MPRTTNPLANLFQAMGQCSTTPAEQQQQQQQQYAQNYGTENASSRSDRSRHASKASSRSYHTAHTSSQQYQAQQQARDDSDVHMTDAAAAAAAASASDNARRGGGSSNSNVASMVVMQQQQRRSRSRSTSRRRTASSSPQQQPPQGPSSAPATPSGTRGNGEGPTILAAPPSGAEKKRCYRLNLEVPGGIPSVDPATGQHIYGPLIYDTTVHLSGGAFRKSSSWHATTAGMRGLHVSTGARGAMLEDDDDKSESETAKDDVQIAIDTAGIFRGITVDVKTGTILSQNARASRSARKSGGDGKKVGEKSRQAAKIDKAKDLVDEDGDGGIDPDSKTQCLYIMGEYDDMKYLVKDGAKKLRDATNLTDEALLSINRQRTSSVASYSNPGTPNSSRKRISPYPTPNSGHFANARSSSRPRSATSNPQGATPKLKANPRDSRSRYGAADAGDCGIGDAENAHMQCGADHPGGGWSTEMLNMSHKLGSIWNCGAQVNSDGTMSPTHPASPLAPGKATQLSAFAVNACGGAGSVMREGRNESAYDQRSSGRAERVGP